MYFQEKSQTCQGGAAEPPRLGPFLPTARRPICCPGALPWDSNTQKSDSGDFTQTSSAMKLALATFLRLVFHYNKTFSFIVTLHQPTQLLPTLKIQQPTTCSLLCFSVDVIIKKNPAVTHQLVLYCIQVSC